MATVTRGLAVRVTLPEELAARYEIQAKGAGMELEDYLAKRLAETLDYDAKHGIYLKDGDRAELTQILERNFNTADELLTIIRQGVTIKFFTRPMEGGLQLVAAGNVVVGQTLLKRAAARAQVEHVDVGEWLGKEAILGLERTCGMR